MSSQPPETNPIPGWYEDPHGPGLRWWDGGAWTTHVLAEAPVAETTPAVEAARDAPDADALLAMYGALPVGTRPARSSGEPSYRGLKVLAALLGLALIAIVVGLLLIGGSDDAVTGPGAPATAPADAQEQARTAQTAIETYRLDHNDSYAGVTVEDLRVIEPTLLDADLSVTSADARGYSLTVTDPATGNVFAIGRLPDGTVSFRCTVPGTADCPKAGCGADLGRR